MKSKLASLIMLLMLSFMLCAQNKNDINKQKKEVTFIVGMHCSSCKERIEKIIPMEKGVKDIKVDLDKKEVTITYNPEKTNVETLKKAIENLGYTCEKKETNQIVSARKHQFLRYARQKNAHLRKVNSAFSDFASLEPGIFLSDTEFSCKH